MTATHPKITASGLHRVCPMCGEMMQSGRCPECSPSEPARAYGERRTQRLSGAAPVVAAVVDARRTTGEWVTEAEEPEPQTRRAHPTLVRTALAEAEERARDRAQRAEFVTRVASDTQPHYRPRSGRLRAVTPLPPEPAAEMPTASAPEPLPVTRSEPPPAAPVAQRAAPLATAFAYADLDDEPVIENRRARYFWIGLAAAVAVMLVLAAM